MASLKTSKTARLLIDLSKNDFSARYLGSYLGIFWAFIHPAVTLVIFWYVFEMGFRVPQVQDAPFFLWLMAGFLPWFYFSESIAGSTCVVIDHQHLVKKMVFNVNLLPLVRVIASLYVQVIYIFVFFVAFAWSGRQFSACMLQVPYYLAFMFFLSLSLSYFTSAVAVFCRDTSQIVTVFLQIFFWVTPIFWSVNNLPPTAQRLFRLNPFFYAVDGYRNSLIYQTWFWNDPEGMLYYWGLTLCFFVVGFLLFRRLKPHFSDVL